MKKYVLVALFLMLPLSLNAQTAAGIEFETPLVQTIINLLHERISFLESELENTEYGELKARIAFLEERNSELVNRNNILRNKVASCSIGGVVETDPRIVEKQREILELEKDFEKYKESIEARELSTSGAAKLIESKRREMQDAIREIRLEIREIELE